MSLHSVSRTLLSVAVAAVVSTSAMADAVVDEGFTFSLGGAYNSLDSERKLDNSWAPEIGVGYRFNDRLSLEGVYSTFKTDHKTKDEAKIKDYRVDAFYDLKPWDGDWTPYGLVGVGHFSEKFDNFSDREDTRMSLGGGVRKALTPNLSLRGDVRAVRSLDRSQTEGVFNVALTWTFGSVAAPVQEPAEEIVQKPVDSDMDGVPDDQDLCPDTPAGSEVNAAGCVPVAEIDLLVEFAFDSDIIKENQVSRVTDMADFLKRYPEKRIRIEGHTDSQGPAAYNEDLSLRRAKVVRDILVDEHGIDTGRIEVVGKGESEPVADNVSLPGKQQNRRVVAELLN